MRVILLVVLLLSSMLSVGQMSLPDTAKAYNKIRLTTNAVGALTLGSWGVTSMVAGGLGASLAQDEKMKYFWQMNAAWGAVNTIVARLVYKKQWKDARRYNNMHSAYADYRKDLKIYRINTGLDVLYIGAGALMVNIADKNSNPDMLKGFGTAIALQGFMLFVYDDLMLITHNRMTGRWARILDEVRFSGTGFNYTIPYRKRTHPSQRFLLHYPG